MPVPTPVVPHDQKVMLHPHFSCLDLRNTVVPLVVLFRPCDSSSCPSSTSATVYHRVRIFHSYVMLTPMTLASCDAIVIASDITKQKNDVAPHFNCLNLKKAMVLLMLLA